MVETAEMKEPMGEVEKAENQTLVYTLEEFAGTDPYIELSRYTDRFSMLGRQNEIERNAKDVGFSVQLFKQKLKEWMKEGKKKEDENYTYFSKQQLCLCCGEFTANDEGIKLNGEMVCTTPLLFKERYRNIETGKEKWVLTHFGYGEWEDLPPIPASYLGNPQKLITLKDYGVSVDSNRAKSLVSYLTTIDELNRDHIPEIKSVGHCGWLKDGSFYPYCEGVQFDGNQDFLPMVNAVEEKGEYTAWIQKVQEVKNRSIEVRLALDATFAAPLISILDALIFIVHLWGESSNGKSTTLQLCASVWGDPARLCHSCKTTQTSLDLRCGTLKNLPLIADETQLLKGNRGSGELGIYDLTQGRGKARSNTTLGQRPTETWANTLVTAGENPLVSSDSMAGEINRVLQIECKDDFDLIGNPGEIKELIRDCHGHAGKRFVEFLSKQKDEIKKFFNDIQRDIRKTVDTSGKQVLMLSILLLTDILVTELFFKGDKPLDPVDLKRYAVSKDDLSDGLRGYDYILSFIARNTSHFKGDAVLEDYGELDGSTVYLIKSVFDKALKDAGFNPTKVLSWMAQHKKIEPGKDRNTKKVRIRGIPTWCVVILNTNSEEKEQQDFL